MIQPFPNVLETFGTMASADFW